jgi:hypothetical protein
MRTALLDFSLAIVFLAVASPALAQAERMSEVEYNSALAKALDAASSHDRRVLTEELYYAGSQVTGTRKIVSDFAGPDAKKTEVTEEFNGKKSKSDSIRIGEQFFCRDGDKGWKRATKECAKSGQAMAIPDGNYEYSVGPDPYNYGRKIYTRRAAWTDSGVPERDAARLKSIEIKFVTDESGAITEYTETRRGGIEPNGWSSMQVTKYDYAPRDLRITDPTKGVN